MCPSPCGCADVGTVGTIYNGNYMGKVGNDGDIKVVVNNNEDESDGRKTPLCGKFGESRNVVTE